MKYQLLVRKWTYVGDGDPGCNRYDYTLEELFRPVCTIAAAKCDATKFVNRWNGWIPRKRDKLPPVEWQRFSCPSRAPGVVNSIVYGISGRYRFDIFKIVEGRR